jgi:hypothetical protein
VRCRCSTSSPAWCSPTRSAWARRTRRSASSPRATTRTPTRRTLILTPGPTSTPSGPRSSARSATRATRCTVASPDQFVEASHAPGALVRGRPQNHRRGFRSPMFQGARATSDNRYLLSLLGEWCASAGTPERGGVSALRQGSALARRSCAERFLDAFDWPSLEAAFKTRLLGHREARQVGARRCSSRKAWMPRRSRSKARSTPRSPSFGSVSSRSSCESSICSSSTKRTSSRTPTSVRATGVRMVFDQRFEKALFLTATPFQLDVASCGRCSTSSPSPERTGEPGRARGRPARRHDRVQARVRDFERGVASPR